MSGVRSKTGCWTCRARKKKCDEHHPRCHTCSFHGIKCHGYGQQPDWMDGGPSQEKELTNIKWAVSQGYKFRRKIGAAHRAALSQKQPAARDSAPSNGFNQKPTDVNEKSQPVEVPIESSRSLLHGEAPFTSVLTARETSYPCTFSAFNAGHSTLSTGAYAEPYLPHPVDIAYNQDLNKIMYFFDHVFPHQHHFYQLDQSIPDQKRGWLLALVMSTDHYHLSALAMSALHQNIFIDRGNVESSKRSREAMVESHCLTLSKLGEGLNCLPTLTGLNFLKLGLGILATMIQLVSFEVFRENKLFHGEMGNWEVHLDGAGTLLGMIDSVVGMMSHSNQLFHSEDSQLHPSATVEAYPVPERVGLKFLTTIYVWADIARCASLGWHYPTTLAFPHKRHLDESLIDLSSLTGCSNWVMIDIMEITRLEEDWRRAFESAHSQTIVVLNQRAKALETQLEVGLANIWKKGVSVTPDERDRNDVTEIFGIAALIYLCIINRDSANSKFKMTAYVKRSISALNSLSPGRLRSVPWPFCVAGCLATTENQKNSFRRILKSAIKARIPLGVTLNSLEIMERWWEMRQAENDSHRRGLVCWRVAMECLNSRILLI